MKLLQLTLVLSLGLLISNTAPAQGLSAVMLATEPGATVIWEGVHLGEADSNGRLRIQGVPRGEFEVEIRKDGFRPKRAAFRVSKEEQKLTVRLVAISDNKEDWGSADPAAALSTPSSLPGKWTSSDATASAPAASTVPNSPAPPIRTPLQTAVRDQLPSSPPEPFVRHGSFFKQIVLTGQLVARNSTTISVPRNSGIWTHLVTDLVPEGSFVEMGDVLVRFDITDLAQKSLDLEKQREDARIQIAQKKAEQETRLQDLRLAVATAQKNLSTAALYVGIDRSLIAASDADQYEFDHAKAKVELAKTEERLAGHAAASAAELEVSQLELDRAEIDLQRVQAELQRMTIRAPAPGLVIHGVNNDNRKIEVGDTLFKGNRVIMLPDMSSLLIRATAFDQDFAQLYMGAPANVILDAYPNRVFPGRVVGLSEAAKPKDRNSDLNLFTVEILLHDTDLSIMKPGMTARAQVPIEAPDSVVVPRRAVRLAAEGSSYVVLERVPTTRVPLEIIDGNAFEVRVRTDLPDGEKLLLGQSGKAETGQRDTDWIEVTREDVKFTVSATGILKAARSEAITPPSVPDTFRFKIIQMVPEGTTVDTGMPLIRFDPTSQIQQLQQEESNLKKVEEEVQKVQASQVLSEGELELELEEAKVALEKAENKLGMARQFDSGRSVKEAELEATLARTRVELLTRKLESTREHSRLQLQILEETARLHERRIQTAREATQRLEVKAPRAGVVIYKRNWNNQKKQVGSDANLGEVILTLPDLESLIIEGQVAEVDAGKIHVGQSVEISLDAIPEKTLPGRIIEIGRIFSQPSRDRPIRVLNIKVQFDQVDSSRMRPEMVARLSIVIDHYRDVISLPLSVIQVQDNRSFVWVERNAETVLQEVRVGENNGVVAVISNGLQVGDRVATIAPIQ